MFDRVRPPEGNVRVGKPPFPDGWEPMTEATSDIVEVPAESVGVACLAAGQAEAEQEAAHPCRSTSRSILASASLSFQPSTPNVPVSTRPILTRCWRRDARRRRG